ncbi:MAG: dipeptidase [Cytophagales bacterium]|nr:dipeptidase [Cytophagales bacterium]
MKNSGNSPTHEYIRENGDRFQAELLEFLSIPSVSTDSSFKDDIGRAAVFVRDRLLDAGADRAELYPTSGHPVVYGEKIVDPHAPTLLCYGHYDVQPADPYDLWKTPPFVPDIRNGRVYARGSADDKGQVYMYVKALETLCRTGRNFCNFKFLIEGEEEIGSPSLPSFLESHKSLLSSDGILISDTSFISEDLPSLTIGVRGLAYLEIRVEGPNRDLHSGEYGGAVENPVHVLCKILSSLKDSAGRITIPGFYEEVISLSDVDRKVYRSIPFNEEGFKEKLGVGEVFGETGYSTLERIGTRPSLDIHGIWGGYIQEGAKTILPSQAHAKLSMRLVPNQRGEDIMEKTLRHLKSICPPTVKLSVHPHHSSEAFVSSTEDPTYKSASKALGHIFACTPVGVRCGGSIPIVPVLHRVLGLSPVLLGFGLPEDAIHSPNESYALSQYWKGIETLCCLFEDRLSSSF